ncbi:hypothetical protein CDD83_1392 [Cordyceps sp. RAO-2017]|nr:hypothetical protein CDD83_1392 [Cordyceps sp. RAO-2017]
MRPVVSVFEAVYGADGGLALSLRHEVGVHGPGRAPPVRDVFPAEVVISVSLPPVPLCVGGEGGERKQNGPRGAEADVVVVGKPDERYVMVSSRNDTILDMPSPGGGNGSAKSDPIVNYGLDRATGRLEALQEVPCGGRFPRHFALSRAGSLLAVAVQKDGRVAVLRRDPATGRLGAAPVAYADVGGEVTSVIFDE